MKCKQCTDDIYLQDWCVARREDLAARSLPPATRRPIFCSETCRELWGSSVCPVCQSRIAEQTEVAS